MRFTGVCVVAALCASVASARSLAEQPKLIPAAPVEILTVAPSDVAPEDLAEGPPLSASEMRALYGVHVTIWQPPHEVRAEDWERAGRRVHEVCMEQHLPLDGNTFCVCRLRVPVECRCHHVDPVKQEEVKEEAQAEVVNGQVQAVHDELLRIMEEHRANMTADAVAHMNAVKERMRRASEQRRVTLREWWQREEERVDAVREERVPEELGRLRDRNYAHMQDELRRRELAQQRMRAAQEIAESKARELQLLRERLKQVHELRRAKKERQLLQRDIKSKQAEIERLVAALEVMKHDNLLRAQEHAEWAERARALERRYREMLENLGPWGQELLERLREQMEKAHQKLEEQNQKKARSQLELYKREEEQLKKLRESHTSDLEARLRRRESELEQQVKKEEQSYRDMLHGVNNVTEQTPCRVNQDCGAEQRCTALMCVRVEEQTPCGQHQDCANEQRCTAGRCTRVQEDTPCTEMRECANWQRCHNDRRVCTVVFEHTACVSSARSCSNQQVCDTSTKTCRGEYDLATELQRRRREQDMLRKQFEDATRSRMQAMEMELRRMRARRAQDGDVVRQVQQMADERRKLQAGRLALEAELQRRASGFMSGDNLPQGAGAPGRVGAGGAGSLDPEVEIRKLMEEIARLKAELAQCKKKPHAYVPTCESDLRFQIERLEKEVQRRKALLLEEVEQMKGKQLELADTLSKCRSQGAGCPPEEEQRLLLTMKRVEDDVTQREAHEADAERVVIMKCLLDHKDDPQIKFAERAFEKSMAEGCPRLRAARPDRDLYSCLCKDWDAEAKIRLQAHQRAALAEQQRVQAQAVEAKQRVVKERKREEAKDMAREVAKELVYQQLQQQGQLEKLLAAARESNPDLVRKLLAEAQSNKGDPKEALRAASDAVKAAQTVSGAGASRDLLNAIRAALDAAKAAGVPGDVRDPLVRAESGAASGRAAQQVADQVSQSRDAARGYGEDKVPTNVRRSVERVAEMANAEAAAALGKVASVPGDVRLPMDTVEQCLRAVESGAVRDNLRKAFATGHTRNGCALLSLASNAMLRQVHKCLCVDTGVVA